MQPRMPSLRDSALGRHETWDLRPRLEHVAAFAANARNAGVFSRQVQSPSDGMSQPGTPSFSMSPFSRLMPAMPLCRLSRVATACFSLGRESQVIGYHNPMSRNAAA